MDEWSVSPSSLTLHQGGHWMLVSYLSIIVVKLSPVDKARAIGQLEAGKSQTEVAATFGVTQGMISKLKTKFRLTGDVKDRPRSGRPKKTTPQQDRFITLSALRNRRVTAPELQRRYRHRYGTDLSAQAIRNRLHAARLKARRPARKPAMTYLHRQARLRWCRQHRPWNLNRWRNVMFSDEARFCLKKVDGRVRV